jgi:hypothetical protein
MKLITLEGKNARSRIAQTPNISRPRPSLNRREIFPISAAPALNFYLPNPKCAQSWGRQSWLQPSFRRHQ